jgi:hypothetical protein
LCLLKHGADPNAKNNNNQTPFDLFLATHRSISFSTKLVFEAMLKNGGKSDDFFFEILQSVIHAKAPKIAAFALNPKLPQEIPKVNGVLDFAAWSVRRFEDIYPTINNNQEKIAPVDLEKYVGPI